MKRNLLRTLALVSALSITSLAMASDPGRCYIRCSNGSTAGPYWSTPESCCEDFQNLCGGFGTAYTEYGTRPDTYGFYCLEALHD